MISLDKTHDPRKNAELLATITGRQLDYREVVREAEELFQQSLSEEFVPLPNKKPSQSVGYKDKITEVLFRLLSKPSSLLEPTRIIVDNKGEVFPDWKDTLDIEYNQMKKVIDREVNVVDFGAVGDGKVDCTSAFKRAIGEGRVKVIVPPGVFLTKGIRLPSWTWLEGSGKGVTTIKLDHQASKGTRLITNANHWKGNHHLLVQGVSLDWNVKRLGDAVKTSTWGNHSSCLTLANVTYAWVKKVEGINPGLHCFDISSTLYNYAGDGYRARGGTKYVWLDQVTGYGFGDDGITTHHSDYIWISNSHMCDPSGRAHQKGHSNSNGIEIDDGSRNVLLVNNSSTRCFGGVEIKAHQNSSAASNVVIIGHISVNDNRSFNFRHIGHHKISDAESQTAFNIVAVNLATIAPVFTDLYEESAPRGMVISAYKNVVVHHFTLMGDPDYDYKGNPIIAVQYQARNVRLNNLSFQGFKHAGADLKVYGGENRADSIKVTNMKTQASTPKPIDVGRGLLDFTIENVCEKQLTY
ncbi:glycosyl hydrolase family 28-related protein [Neobacillus rhizosphaerae]|uniref:glycosyl hydrolase family 28-related protein n=1 Tax=Neobacillus rhizosphaerae TaxID=2880965 RepID=UPI003D27DFDD